MPPQTSLSPSATSADPARGDAGDSARADHPLWGELMARVKETWGFDALRPHQDEAIRASLEGRDALVVLPTGGGKSLCYQAPALVRDGLTVVVSPLISLMRDQLAGLQAHGVAAGMLSSNQDRGERQDVFEGLARRDLKILFVSPERLAMPGFATRLREAGIAALAVDEAHCISHWGHDFRPEYRMLGELRQLWPGVAVQAYTATATPRVREDIMFQLGLREPLSIVGSFDRPNLTYRALQRHKLLDQVLEVLERHGHQPGGTADGAGIIYCLRRKDVDKLNEQLQEKGLKSAAYHAGLSGAERRRVQEAFRNERVDLIVATVAFGMGIDRPDVRFVIHASLPKGLEQYSQETGRAGRDGLPSECTLLFGGADYQGWKSLMEKSIAEAADAGHQNPDALRETMNRGLSHIYGYATSGICRHKQLVAYFGQELEHSGPEGCGACDVCLGELEAIKEPLVVAQKILSCVARCDQRYGAGHIAEVLRGGSNDRIRRMRHDQLSTYGLLKTSSVKEIRSWIDQLAAQELLFVTPGQYPTIQLTPKSLPVLRGEETPTLFQPKLAPTKSRSRRSYDGRGRDDLDQEERELFERLRTVRRELARRKDVPPYVICSDRTLVAMVEKKPQTLTSFRSLHGIGARKADDYGFAFLEAIRAHLAGEE